MSSPYTHHFSAFGQRCNAFTPLSIGLQAHQQQIPLRVWSTLMACNVTRHLIHAAMFSLLPCPTAMCTDGQPFQNPIGKRIWVGVCYRAPSLPHRTRSFPVHRPALPSCGSSCSSSIVPSVRKRRFVKASVRYARENPCVSDACFS